MLLVICVLFGVAVAVVAAALLWPTSSAPAGEETRTCDVCGAPATVRVVTPFADEAEGEMAGGGSVMVADLCPIHAADNDQLAA